MENNFKNKKSVRSENSFLYYTEYDQYNRVTFYSHNDKSYWCLKFYNEPKKDGRVDRTPYQVIHKSWSWYNELE